MKRSYDEIKEHIISSFADCDDLIIRESGSKNARFVLFCLKGISSRDYISEMILRPLLKTDITVFDGNFGALLESVSLSEPKDENEILLAISRGLALIITESRHGCFFTLANAQVTNGRSVQEPSSDITLKGPKTGFVEDFETNLSLLRKYIPTPELKSIPFTVGSVSKTRVLLVYVNGRADGKTVERIKKKLESIEARVITDSANIAMLLDGTANSFLPSCGSTEKVDKTASKLMAGRIGIIVDGSPFVLTVPYLFVEGLQASDDYYHTPVYATFIRFLRFAAFLSAIFAPAILSTVVNYNVSILPEQFLSIISESRKEIPVTFFWEIVIVLLLFEVLREVGIRMPRTVGDAVGIVGSIILGNTAVEAGIVSSIGVITVAFSAVCAFITPAFMYFIVFARIFVLLFSELFGIWGIVISSIALFLLLALKKSYGTHYLYPLIPFDAKGMQDFIFSWPKKTLGRNERLKK